MTDDALAPPRPITRDVIRVLLATALLLIVPFLAMQFTGEVAWDMLDFAVAGVLLAGTGLMYVMLARKTARTRNRLLIGVALAAALGLVWLELAVGLFGTPLAGS